MTFDPSQLGAPVGTPTQILEHGGMNRGDVAPEVLGQAQVYQSPDGPIVKNTMADGQIDYYMPHPGGTVTAFTQDADGGWKASERGKSDSSIGGLFKNMTSDPKFMSFLAIAAGGVALSAYAGGASAAGAGTAGTTGSQLTAAELASINGAGVVESGSLAAGGYTMPAASTAAGGVLSSAAPAAVAPAASTVSTAAVAPTAATVSNGLAPASTWYGQLFNTAMANPQVTAGIISGIGQGIAGYQKSDDDEAMLDKRLAHEAAESDKAIAAKSRNFQGDSYAKINWGERPNLTTEMPVMRNTSPTPIGMKLSRTGVLERESRSGR